MSTPSQIVALLKEASAAYYNGGPLKMDDDTFDALQDKLRELDPDNPYLSTVGAPPTGDVVKLPYAMPSLDKIKPGQDALRRFLSTQKTLILSEKLDGLSAMWIPDRGALYLRGNGKEGQDVSHLVPLGIQGLVKAAGAVIRGELVVPRTAVSVLARSWVNGIIHRKDPDPVDVSKIRFVAYDLLSPANKTRAQAFQWLRALGFELPWFAAEAAGASATTEESLKAALLHRRKDSPYDTDGIVVAVDAVPQRPKDAKNPKDAVAFKMPLADQSAETTVRAVLWAPSAQGYLIPKVEFDPVTIGSATIQFASAHNAKLVESSGLGPGARIVIRRSGDVIPTIDKVLVGAASGPQMPPNGTYEWASDVHIKQIGESKEQIAAKLQHFLKTLEIPGAGPATAVALVEAGITGPKKLLLASPETLGSLLGPKTGATLYKSVRAALEGATELQLMIASSSLPRGVGESKLKVLFEAEPDPKRWTLESRPGWTEASLAAFLEQLPAYFKWREEEISYAPKAPVKPVGPVASPTKREIFCMTGFRDKALEASLIAAGHSVSATLTGKVTVLLVPDGERKESEKMKAAAARGVPILSASVAKAKYLS